MACFLGTDPTFFAFRCCTSFQFAVDALRASLALSVKWVSAQILFDFESVNQVLCGEVRRRRTGASYGRQACGTEVCRRRLSDVFIYKIGRGAPFHGAKWSELVATRMFRTFLDYLYQFSNEM